MLLHVFRHIDTQQRVLIVKQKFGQRARQFGLANACWTEKKTSDRAQDRSTLHAVTDRVGHSPGAASFHHRCRRRSSMLMSFLTSEHLRDRNAGHFETMGDILFVHFFLQHAGLAFHLRCEFLSASSSVGGSTS
jgi:hypothetical protein